MKKILILLFFLASCSTVPKSHAGMKVMTPSKLASIQGTDDIFTGKVTVTPLMTGEAPSNLQAALVSFTPGARSAWHRHPRGQLLVVTEGSGLIQESGKSIQKISKGDVVWTPPGVKHWHGASSDKAMSHTAIQESLNGKVVEWMEKVSDEQYRTR